MSISLLMHHRFRRAMNDRCERSRMTKDDRLLSFSLLKPFNFYYLPHISTAVSLPAEFLCSFKIVLYFVCVLRLYFVAVMKENLLFTFIFHHRMKKRSEYRCLCYFLVCSWGISGFCLDQGCLLKITLYVVSLPQAPVLLVSLD